MHRQPILASATIGAAHHASPPQSLHRRLAVSLQARGDLLCPASDTRRWRSQVPRSKRDSKSSDAPAVAVPRHYLALLPLTSVNAGIGLLSQPPATAECFFGLLTSPPL